MNSELNINEAINGLISSGEVLTGTLSSSSVLTGSIGASGLLNGLINANAGLQGTIIESNVLKGDLSMEAASYPVYSGDYEVTPSTESQTLNTMNKVMADDVSIKEIPYFETSNEYGKTIYIGSEVIINGN